MQTVSGRTSASRPSPGRSFGAAAATNAAPSPGVTAPLRFLSRRFSSSCSLVRSAAGRLPKSRLPPTERVKGGVHDHQVEFGQAHGDALGRALDALAADAAHILGDDCEVAAAAERHLHGRFSAAEEFERAEPDVFAFGAQRHRVEVHFVELNVGVEHRQAGGGEVDRGELDIKADQGLLDEHFVERGGVASARVGVAALRFGGDGHEERAGAAGEVGNIQGGGEFVVAPVDVFGPAVKDKLREHRRGGHGGVVGAAEFGVGQQRVEEAAGEVVAFEVAGLVDGPEQRAEDGELVFGVAVAQHAQEFSGDLENGHVVDVGADRFPGRRKRFDAAGGDFLDGGDVGAREREAAMKREGVEEHQAANPFGRLALLLVVRLGDDLRDEVRDSRVGVEPLDGLGQGVADFERGGVDAVGPLDFQRQQAQLRGQRLHLPFAHHGVVVDFAARTVQIPLEIAQPAEHIADVVLDLEVVGVEHAEAGDRVGEVGDALRELAVKVGA